MSDRPPPPEDTYAEDAFTPSVRPTLFAPPASSRRLRLKFRLTRLSRSIRLLRINANRQAWRWLMIFATALPVLLDLLWVGLLKPFTLYSIRDAWANPLKRIALFIAGVATIVIFFRVPRWALWQEIFLVCQLLRAVLLLGTDTLAGVEMIDPALRSPFEGENYEDPALRRRPGPGRIL